MVSLAGQAGDALNTIAVLQAYQVDLLKDTEVAEGVAPAEIKELCCTTDLVLRATKQADCAINLYLAALVTTKRHLWLNLSGLKEKERSFLLDAPISPVGLFGSAVEMVGRKFREAKVKSEAFKRYIPHRRRRPSIPPAGDRLRKRVWLLESHLRGVRILGSSLTLSRKRTSVK